MKILNFNQFSHKINKLLESEMDENLLKEIEEYKNNLKYISFRKNLFIGLLIFLIIAFISMVIFNLIYYQHQKIFLLSLPTLFLFVLVLMFSTISVKWKRKYEEKKKNTPKIFTNKTFLNAICCDENFTTIATQQTLNTNFIEKQVDLNFEFRINDIPNYAQVVEEKEVLKFYSTTKFQDIFILNFYKCHWIKEATTYNSATKSFTTTYVDVYKEFYALYHLINPNNIIQERELDYELFNSTNSNVNLESSTFNKQAGLIASDQIKARMLFTPAIQLEILENRNNSILKTFCIKKQDNLIKILFKPLNEQFSLFKNAFLYENDIKNAFSHYLKRDVYGLLELLRFSIYRGKWEDFSY